MTVLDANDNLPVDVAAAGNDSLVVVDGSAGTINTVASVTLQTGQALIGGGDTITVTAAGSGRTAALPLPGSRPTISGAVNSNGVLVTNIDSTVSGLTVINTDNGANSWGIEVRNSGGARIFDSTITATSTTGAGVSQAILVLDSDNVIIRGNTLAQTGTNDVLAIANSDNVVIGGNRITESARDGIYIFNSNMLTISNNSFGNIGRHVMETSGSSFAPASTGNRITGTVAGMRCSDWGGNTGTVAFADGMDCNF